MTIPAKILPDSAFPAALNNFGLSPLLKTYAYVFNNYDVNTLLKWYLQLNEQEHAEIVAHVGPDSVPAHFYQFSWSSGQMGGTVVAQHSIDALITAMETLSTTKSTLYDHISIPAIEVSRGRLSYLEFTKQRLNASSDEQTTDHS